MATRHAILASLAMLPVALPLHPAQAAVREPPPPLRSPRFDDSTALEAAARNTSLPRERRVSAVVDLAVRHADDDARRALVNLLRPGSDPSVVLEGLALAPIAPPDVLQPLRSLAELLPRAETPSVLHAASSVRTRDAAAFLLDYTPESEPLPIRTAAFEALARLSGRADLGTDVPRWRQWLATVRAMSEPAWQAELVAGLAVHADALGTDIRAASGRVVDALRRLYLATPPSERSGLLTAMLLDDSAGTRSLGFELASRELSASRRLDDSVGEVALRLLSDPDPSVRAGAAALVNRLNPPQAEARVLDALERETDPIPAAAMIQAATRRPSPVVINAVFRWLDRRGPAFGAAADAAWALLRSGNLTVQLHGSRILDAMRATPDVELTASCCAMLGAIGGTEGVERLTSLLHSAAPSLRVAAAQALVVDPAALVEIVEAARQEPQLFDTAAQSVMMFNATGAGFRAVGALPAPSPDAKRRALLAIAALLPATDLLEVARDQSNDMALRESYLTLLASPDRILSERADPARLSAIAEGVMLLARTRIALERPDAAVAALDALPELSDLVDHLRVSRLRAMAMLCLNRMDDAVTLNAPPSVWLDALERCMSKPFAHALAAEIRARFASELGPDEAQRLARLTELLPPAPPPQPEDRDFVGPPLPQPR